MTQKEIELEIVCKRGEIELLKNLLTELNEVYVKCLREKIYREGGITISIDTDYDQHLVDILTEVYWDRFDEELRESARIRNIK